MRKRVYVCVCGCLRLCLCVQYACALWCMFVSVWKKGKSIFRHFFCCDAHAYRTHRHRRIQPQTAPYAYASWCMFVSVWKKRTSTIYRITFSSLWLCEFVSLCAIHVCTYTHTIHTHAHIHACVTCSAAQSHEHTFILTHTRTNAHKCTHICHVQCSTVTWTRANIRTQTYTRLQRTVQHSHKNTRTHVHTYTCTNIHTHLWDVSAAQSGWLRLVGFLKL